MNNHVYLLKQKICKKDINKNLITANLVWSYIPLLVCENSRNK